MVRSSTYSCLEYIEYDYTKSSQRRRYYAPLQNANESHMNTLSTETA